MSLTHIGAISWMILLLTGFPTRSFSEIIRLYFDPSSPQIAFAAGDIKAALEKRNHSVLNHDLATLKNAGSGKKIVLAVATDHAIAGLLAGQEGKPAAGLGEQAYALRTTDKPDLSYWALGTGR